jgi:hypothetical protein
MTYCPYKCDVENAERVVNSGFEGVPRCGFQQNQAFFNKNA